MKSWTLLRDKCYETRPDIVAHKGENSFIVEVKTSNSSVIRLKREDLQGINGAQGLKPVIAVLSYPDVEIHWILVDASRLGAGDYLKSSLKIFGMKDIESEMNKQFFAVIKKHQSSMMLGTNLLLQVFREEQAKAL